MAPMSVLSVLFLMLQLDKPNTVVRLVRASTSAATDAQSGMCSLTNVRDSRAWKRLSATETNTWTWRKAQGDLISCSEPGFEPLDVDGDAHDASELNVVLLPARSLTLASRMSGELTIEWRENAGRKTHVLATRTFSAIGALTVPIATRARFVRVHRPQAAPITLFFPDGTSDLQAELPNAVSGGELYAELPDIRVVPKVLLLNGSSTEMTLTVDPNGRFQHSGLQPGTYALIPVYEGGLKGPSRNVPIVEGVTTELLPLQIPETGGLLVTADPEFCDAATTEEQLEILVRRLVGTRSVSYNEVFRDRIAHQDCEWRIGGLEAGKYDVSIQHRAEGLLATSDFLVEAGEFSAVTLDKPRISVHGRVTFGSRDPVPDVVLGFSSQNVSYRTKTNENGEYRIGLSSPGDYDVTIRAARYLPAASFPRRFMGRVQRADFELPLGRIYAHFERDDGAAIAEPMQISLMGPQGQGAEGFVLPEEGPEVQLRGLEYGAYRLTAHTGSGLVSREPVYADLTELSPIKNVNVVLTSSGGVLRVTDTSGTPISGAVVWARPRMLVEESPGVFSLLGVAPGNAVEIVAPYGLTSVCRILTNDDLPAFSVALTPATEPATIRISPPVDVPTGEILGLPGSNCPVGLLRLNTTLERQGMGTVLGIANLPVGEFLYRVSPWDAVHVLKVPGPVLSLDRTN